MVDQVQEAEAQAQVDLQELLEPELQALTDRMVVMFWLLELHGMIVTMATTMMDKVLLWEGLIHLMLIWGRS